MKRLPLVLAALVFFYGSPVFAALDLPALSGRVVDDAGILSATTKQSLIELFAAHEASTSNQIVVVTLPSLQGTTIEDFGVVLGRQWQIGQEDRNNGVLLIVAPNERKVRIEVGYGLEGDLTDAMASHIIQTEILPAFRTGNMEDGIIAGARAIIGTIDGSYEAPPDSFLDGAGLDGEGAPPVWVMLLALIILILIVFILFKVASSEGFAAYRAYSRSSRRSSWGGGFSSGGFSGGGGSFGGGGASGGW